jgi:hypothetical protein
MRWTVYVCHLSDQLNIVVNLKYLLVVFRWKMPWLKGTHKVVDYREVQHKYGASENKSRLHREQTIRLQRKTLDSKEQYN